MQQKIRKKCKTQKIMSKNGVRLIVVSILFVFLPGIVIVSSEKADSCEADGVILAIKDSFRSIIPTYNPSKISLQLSSELELKPTDKRLSTFLIEFKNIGENVIDKEDKELEVLQSAMRTVLDYEYTEFLHLYGRPLSCISYLLGTVENHDFVTQIYKEAFRIHQSPLKKIGSRQLQTKEPFSPLEGSEILSRLHINAQNRIDFNLQNSKPTDAICAQIIAESRSEDLLEDSQSLKLLPKKIYIPGEDSALDARKINVTHNLESYFMSGLSCLDTEELRSNFASVVSTWISEKVVPKVLGSRLCVQGYSRILSLLALVDSYTDISKESRSPDEQSMTIQQNQLQSKSTIFQHTNNDENMNDTHEKTDTQPASTILFVIFFGFLIPLFCIIYYLYKMLFNSPEDSGSKFRKWLSKTLKPMEKNSENVCKRISKRHSHKKRYSSQMDMELIESQKLIETPSLTEDDEALPSNKKNAVVKPIRKNSKQHEKSFRPDSRDIYIQMVEKPLDISIEDRTESSNNDSDGSSVGSPNMSDEFSLFSATTGTGTGGTKKASLEKTKRKNPEIQRNIQKSKSRAKPIKFSKHEHHNSDDEDEDEELFNRYNADSKKIHDFTSPRKKNSW